MIPCEAYWQCGTHRRTVTVVGEYEWQSTVKFLWRGVEHIGKSSEVQNKIKVDLLEKQAKEEEKERRRKEREEKHKAEQAELAEQFHTLDDGTRNNTEIAESMGISRSTVVAYRKRFKTSA